MFRLKRKQKARYALTIPPTKDKAAADLAHLARLSSSCSSCSDITASDAAAGFLLGIAKLSFQDLQDGQKADAAEQLHSGRVDELREGFGTRGVHRTAPGNRFRVLCSRPSFLQMLSHVGKHHSTLSHDESLDFLDWGRVVRGEPLRLLAGWHRMAALQQHTRLTNGSTDEWWWSCELYDAGNTQRLPLHKI